MGMAVCLPSYARVLPAHAIAERYNYDATQAFNYSTFPLSRFVNEFGYVD